MTESLPFVDLINSWDFGFGSIFGIPISFLFLFLLLLGVIWRFEVFDFGWIGNLINKRKSKKIGLIKKILLHLKLAEIKRE